MATHAYTIDLEPWPYEERPRVLIEHPDPYSGLELAAALRRVGCSVAFCRGPGADGDLVCRCPVSSLGGCVAVEGADVVVTALDFDGEDGRDVLHGLRTRYPSKPLVVETTVADSLELTNELEGCTVLPQDVEPERVVTAVLDAFAG